MSQVEGKVILVTGGASGIGLEYVKELLANGAKGVTIADISTTIGKKVADELADKYGPGKVVFVKTDVRNESELEDVFRKTVENFRQLDIVINNAGIINEVDWEETLSINLAAVIRGTILAAENYFNKYRSGTEGVIVNTASVAGLAVMPMLPVYAATKAGVIQFTRSYGTPEHYKHYPVRVMALCPSMTETNLKKFVFSEDKIGWYTEFAPGRLDALPIQPVECLGKALIDVLERGTNGSVWVIEDEKLYEVVLPEKEELRKQ